MKKSLLILPVFILSALLLGGCVKPYDKPEYIEIEPNQTAFVIPLEEGKDDQAQFQSKEFLQDAQVATKRIDIPHKWVKTGRLASSGEYVDKIRVIVVDRYPATREWKGKSSFVGESNDSIKFNQGLSTTAQILEEDAAVFLYQYSGKSLEEVMDSEVRNKIGSVLLEQYSKLKIEEIRGDKSTIINNVLKDVEPYFKERGITLSNIGYIGSLKYTDNKIQEAINKKFNAEEEQKAQKIQNQTEIDKATSEAKANGIRQQSMKEIVEMKELEIKEAWIKKWDGKLPTVSGSEGSMMIDLESINK